jgi:hypothetical protein
MAELEVSAPGGEQLASVDDVDVHRTSTAAQIFYLRQLCAHTAEQSTHTREMVASIQRQVRTLALSFSTRGRQPQADSSPAAGALPADAGPAEQAPGGSYGGQSLPPLEGPRRGQGPPPPSPPSSRVRRVGA